MEMGRTTKVVGFSVPPALEREMELVAKQERRTKSELFREMFRLYKRFRQQQDQEDEAWVMNLIREAKEEQATNPKSPDELVADLKAFAYEFSKRAKELGITGKDVNRIIYESRKRWGTA
ncbi:hypothetical protein HYZ98_04260 [Candidatus Peregrinibacteria bacterium]|nr:hypothetical protein [Candidatus Peregrinibacteria bacterium]